MATYNGLRCPHCGAPIRDSFLFCMECGEQIKRAPEVRQKQSDDRLYTSEQPDSLNVSNQAVERMEPYPGFDSQHVETSTYERREFSQTSYAPSYTAPYNTTPVDAQPMDGVPNESRDLTRGPSTSMRAIVQPTSNYESDVTDVYIPPQSKVGKAKSAAGLGFVPTPSRSALDDEETMVVQNNVYVLTSKDTNESYSLTLPCVVGRSRNASDVKVSTRASVSRRHARIYMVAGTIMIQDMATTNGTYVDGVAVSNDAGTQLVNGCTVRLGDEDYTFELRGR